PQFGYRFFVQRSVVLHVQQNLDLGWIRCPGPNRCYLAGVDSSEEDWGARLYPARVTKIGAIWNGVATQLRVDQVDDRERQDRGTCKDKGSDFRFCGH